MMEIILREPIENLGGRGDVVEVANGYARNYLLPRRLALPVTESNRRQGRGASAWSADQPGRPRSARPRRALRTVWPPWSACSRGASASTETLYGSVTAADIAEYAGRSGSLPVDKRADSCSTEPIKQLGEVTVQVRRSTAT